MKYSDVRERHIYSVDFDPVNKSEFDRRHLAVVLKKNNDKRTVLVAPLTTSSNGEGYTKKNIGKIASLPRNLNSADSYIVYNQTRTVNIDRFMQLKEDGKKIQCKIDTDIFADILVSCSEEILKEIDAKNRLNYHKSQYINYAVTEAVNIAYDIKRSLESKNIANVKQMQSKIKGILDLKFDYTSYIKFKDIENGIKEIIDACMDDSLRDKIEINPEAATAINSNCEE
ncbi:MAG: type II toxin-antitoxin system PemK/MazF family toxin [Clostridium perfringens]